MVETITCVGYIQGNRIISGFLMRCEQDFVHPQTYHRTPLGLLRVPILGSLGLIRGPGPPRSDGNSKYSLAPVVHVGMLPAWTKPGTLVHVLGPPVVPFSPLFGWEGFPTKIDYRKKSGTLILTSLLEDLVYPELQRWRVLRCERHLPALAQLRAGAVGAH